MLTFKTDALGVDYQKLLRTVVVDGDLVEPRGERTYEVRPLVLELSNPQKCIVSRPKFSKKLMWMEIIQLLAGKFDKSLFEAISPPAAGLMDAYGAYGPRTWRQLQEVEAELKRDPDSRRAVVFVGKDGDLDLAVSDLGIGMPCTSSWQFFVRNERLDMHVTMRSWDLVWGLSYDVPCFVAVQQAMTRALHLQLGTYTHVAGSGHVYDRHLDLIKDIEETHEELELEWNNEHSMSGVTSRARQVMGAIQHGLPGMWENSPPWHTAARLFAGWTE